MRPGGGYCVRMDVLRIPEDTSLLQWRQEAQFTSYTTAADTEDDSQAQVPEKSRGQNVL